MIEQKTQFPIAGQADRAGRPADARQAVAAIIAVTRREWLAQGRAAHASAEAAARRPRPAQPSIRFAPGAKGLSETA